MRGEVQIEERSEEEGEFLCSSKREKKGTAKRENVSVRQQISFLYTKEKKRSWL